MSDLTLDFDPDTLTLGDKDVRRQLSAVALDGDRLWLGCDEGTRIEGLSRVGPSRFGQHEVFRLHTLITLPADDAEEVDIEGMYMDAGWLWLVGSHSAKRKTLGDDATAKQLTKKLHKVDRRGNRHLLARIPIVDGMLRRRDGGRRAATLAATSESSALLDALRADDHLSSFIDIPGKDNGFDIEGLAVRGSRVWVGLRSPVLREWSCILELQVDANGSELRLKKHGGALYRKHFFRLDGLGIRDIVLLDDDLLILAGPSMAHDGPAGIWRWKDGARKGAASVPAADRIKKERQLPQRNRVDKPEGIAVYERGGGSTSLLVVFDSPAATRIKAPGSVRADLITI